MFYQQSGQKVFGWNEMIARRRPHILWLIEHHPDHEMDVWQVSADADPVGYAEAKKRWLAQTAKPDASVRVLQQCGVLPGAGRCAARRAAAAACEGDDHRV